MASLKLYISEKAKPYCASQRRKHIAMKPKILISTSQDPCLNLAAEEFCFRDEEQDYTLLYTNRPSVVVGKHQNIYKEINYRYVHEHGIALARRMSGGGTVYHDEGNLNFSFICNGKAGQMVNFRKYAAPVLGYLRGLNPGFYFSERNDIMIGGKKVSGNAEHIRKTRALHHGTLLFDSNLKHLRQTLADNSSKYMDRSVESVRKSVTNITAHTGQKPTMIKFTEGLANHLGQAAYFDPAENKEIVRLCQEKYRSREWIIGYSPKYRFKNHVYSMQLGSFDIDFSTENAIITEARISNGELGNKKIYRQIEEKMRGQFHGLEEICTIFEEVTARKLNISTIFPFF